jgi:hypothetical protein
VIARDIGPVQKLIAKIDALKQLIHFVACICLVDSVSKVLVDGVLAGHSLCGIHSLKSM